MESNEFKDSLKYPKIYTNEEQKELENKFFDLIDEYQNKSSFESREFMCYLTSAIYLTYRELYPRLSIYIPFRTKSDTSFTKNIQKEFNKFIKDTNSQKPFDTTSITKDILAMKIVLNDINYSLPSSKSFEELLNDPKISKLMDLSNKNVSFVDDIDKYLRSPIRNGKKFFELKKELLKRMLEITPEEFTDERKPNPSFSQLYEEAKFQYDYFLEYDSFPTLVAEADITELSQLSNDFRSRVYDQLHFAILDKTLPIVFNSPLIKNALKTYSEYEKESKKSNGFQARYDTLNTPFGPIEVISQSNKAYYTSTKGSSYHSGMAGKNIDIKNFFELVDKNDEYDISYYLDILDSISADKALVSPYEIPEFETKQEKEDFLKTPEGIAFLESEHYRELMKHIKIKEEMQLFPAFPAGGSYQNNPDKLQQDIDAGNIEPITTNLPFTINTDEYLLSTALSLSPYMNVCGSGHTSFSTSVIHHKKIIGEFAEVLRKRDANTCLIDLLIRRLEYVINNPPENPSPHMRACIDVVKEHEESANKLPKDISRRNILKYAETFRNKQKNNSDFELDLS